MELGSKALDDLGLSAGVEMFLRKFHSLDEKVVKNLLISKSEKYSIIPVHRNDKHEEYWRKIYAPEKIESEYMKYFSKSHFGLLACDGTLGYTSYIEKLEGEKPLDTFHFFGCFNNEFSGSFFGFYEDGKDGKDRTLNLGAITDERFAKQGVGYSSLLLLLELLSYMREKNCIPDNQIFATARPDNEGSNKVFQNLGFTQASERPVDFGYGERNYYVSDLRKK